MTGDEPTTGGDAADRVLVVRNDRLGDFVLALPAFAMLRRSMPGLEISALVPAYTESLARAVPEIDRVVVDPGRGSGLRSLLALRAELRARRFGGAVVLFSTGRVAAALALAGVPYRLAPATKPAQLFYTERLIQRRSRSAKPEFEYNLDLVRAYLARRGIRPVAADPPFLRFADSDVQAHRVAFRHTEHLDPALRLVLVHPGSGGSAPNLDPDGYVELATRLRSDAGHCILVTAGPGERPLADQVAGRLEVRGVSVRVVYSAGSLAEFARTVALADVVVGGSTGPLHLAGALDRPTAVFYPRTRAGSSLRWRTLNREEHRLAFEPPERVRPEDVAAIDVVQAADEISRRFLGAGPAAG